jgi:hypothetical protein
VCLWERPSEVSQALPRVPVAGFKPEDLRELLDDDQEGKTGDKPD